MVSGDLVPWDQLALSSKVMKASEKENEFQHLVIQNFSRMESLKLLWPLEQGTQPMCLTAALLNLWVVVPMGVAYLISCITDTCIMIYNNSKITMMM